MTNLYANLTEILILAFLFITFIQSSFDKLLDWKGNAMWLKEHFSQTFVKSFVELSMVLIVLLELICSAFCVVGIVYLISNDDPFYGRLGALSACIILLCLLFGQRIAKDYDGARTIAIYFIIAVFGVYLLQ
ncbi:DoxX family protein [Zhouia sp. PK063]|uniref:DoxX family protein n=1 Tax=Zhouia sp. PK063 TaxID=3373602 RepID=UPI0037AF3875